MAVSASEREEDNWIKLKIISDSIEKKQTANVK